MVTPQTRGSHAISSDKGAADVRQRLEDLSRLVSDWLWETDSDLRLVYLSDRVMEILGYPAQEFRGKKLEDLGEFVSQTEEPVDVNWRSPFRDLPFKTATRGGEKRILLISGLPVFDEYTGEFIGVRGTAKDITERRRIEEALERQKSLFEAVFRDSPNALVMGDSERKIFMCNPAFDAVFGYTPEEIIGQKTEVLYESPEEYERQGRLRYNLSFKEKSEPYVVNYRRKDGEVFPGETVGTPVRDENGKILGFLGVIKDITIRQMAENARRESEARSRRMFQDSALGMILGRLNGMISEVNPAFCRMLGYTQNEIKELSIIDLTHPDDRPGMLERRKDFADGSVEFNPLEKRYVHKDGHAVWVRGTGSLIRDGLGQPAYVLGQLQEVTETKKLEDAARAERELLKDAIESIADGVVLFDKDDRFVLCNNSYRKNLEKLQDLLVPGTPFEDIARSAAQSGIITWNEGDLDDYVQDRMEKHKSREPILLHFPENDRWFMVYDYQTSDGGSFIIRTDITQQKKFEDELQENRNNFLAAIDNMSESFALFDGDDCLIQCNQNYLDSFAPELQAKIIPGISFEELVKIAADNNFYPLDGKTKDEVVQERLEQHRNPKESLEITRPDGRCFIFNESKIPGGGTVLLRRDITERKQAELALSEARDGLENRVKERTKALSQKVKEHRLAEDALRVSEIHLRSIMENIVEAVITISEDGSMESFNPAAEEMFGYAAGEVLGENVSMLTDEPERSEHDYYLQTYLQSGKATIIGKGFREVRGRRKDGSIFPAELAVSEVRRGRNINFIGTLRDVTQRKETEKTLRAAKERAEFANRAKTEFLAHMSHELRTPLNAILGYSEILKSELFGPLGDEKYPEYVGNINEAGTHLLSLLSDILDVSKVEAGEIDIEDEDIDIRDIIRECKVMVQEKADIAKISLSWRAGQDLPFLRADGRRVKQIILNLLSNALKFTPERGKVVIGVQQAENGGVIIKVSDTGIGIAKEDIPTILQPFTQLTEAYVSSPDGGSGLGLSLVKSLTELHGGSLDIDSTPGVGTKVSVIFPPERTIKEK